jgi:cellulose synthase/poly-beta-1,6-N-acetylglucosamine synthase-like glycosyltransferase
MPAAVGIMAYNEGAVIAASVRSVLEQRGPHVNLGRVTVVASGCTDDTVAQARAAAGTDPRFRLLQQARRQGKAAAITALLESLGSESTVVLVGGDTVLPQGSLEALLAPLEDDAVGMVGGRPVPVNRRTTTMGRVVHLLWELHHQVALGTPKLGELVAFRRVLSAVPGDSAVDEAQIEAMVRDQGLRLVYAPEAVVNMRGPGTIRDYLAQRRRIHAGHLQLRQRHGYAVSTMSWHNILAAIRQTWRQGHATTGTILAAVALEGSARCLGWWDARVTGRDHSTWERISSTKDLSS